MPAMQLWDVSVTPDGTRSDSEAGSVLGGRDRVG